MKSLRGRNGETKRLERPIAGIDKLIHAMNSQVRLRRRDKTHFKVLPLDCVAGAKLHGTTGELKKPRREEEDRRKEFGERVLQGNAIVTRRTFGSKAQMGWISGLYGRECW